MSVQKRGQDLFVGIIICLYGYSHFFVKISYSLSPDMAYWNC